MMSSVRWDPEKNHAERRAIYGDEHVDAEWNWEAILLQLRRTTDIRDNRDPQEVWKQELESR